MRPVRIIAAVVVAATVGMLTLLAVPAWAAPVAIHVSPSSVAAGHTVTLSGSVGPDSAGSECASRVTLISKAFVHTYDFAGLPAVVAAVKPGGVFTATTTIPRSTAAGTYTITGRCGGGNLGVSATLVVRTAATTTSASLVPLGSHQFGHLRAPDAIVAHAGADDIGLWAPPATAPPVTHPPVGQPTVPASAVTGLPIQPATPAAAQPPSRWIIPGLAALGSGTLAALGVWLLYRRRHPAGSSRRGRSRMAH